MRWSGRHRSRYDRPRAAHNNPPLAPLIVALLAAAAVVAAAPASAVAGRSPAVRALVLGKARSPVLKSFARRPRVRVQRASRARHRGPRHHKLLIIDGDNLSPKQMLRRPLIGRYFARRRWILALDLKTRHHARATSRYTGFDSPGPRGRHRSSMFLFRRAVNGSTPSVPMIDAQNLAPRAVKRLSSRRRRVLRRREARRLARLVRSVIKPGIGEFEGDSPPAEDAPPEALHIQFPLTKTGHEVPGDGFWHGPGDENDAVGIVPDHGHQTANWTMHHTFDVYLQNPLNPTQSNPDKQIVTYNLNGEYTPKFGNEQFWQMFKTFRVYFANQNLERAWWTGNLGVSVKPHDAATNAKLTWEGNQPRTPDSETTYESSEKFNVNVTVSTGGAKAAGNYSVGTSETKTVPDWGVESTTGQSDLEWMFSSRSPCDPRPDHYSEVACFEQRGGTPKLPNQLSRGQLQVFAQGRWSTSQELRGDAGRLVFAIDTPVRLIDTYCGNWGLTSCCQTPDCGGNQRLIKRYDASPVGFNAVFNVADVLPVPIKSLTFDPPCANGSSADSVTGIVKLKHPVPQEFEHVTVDVFSDSENAVVGPPFGHGSQTTAKIKGGKSSGTFKIETNDNKLQPGGHTRAAISIFYGDSETEQLEIFSGACPS